jgi:hypothetical protein
MKKRWLALVLGLSGFVLSPASANVCGSSMSKYIVPDYVCFDAQGSRTWWNKCDRSRTGDTLVRHQADFTRACERHDACYGKKDARKSSCDATFYRDLLGSCRAQLDRGVPESTKRRCIETALQANDVVRGQATRRVGDNMVQQVPFTGRSACQAFVKAQARAGRASALCD